MSENAVTENQVTEIKPQEAPKEAKVPKEKLTSKFQVLKPEQYKRVQLPKDENDPLWDPKMLNPVPDKLVEGLAVKGWDPTMPLRVIPGPDGTLRISNGRTKWRALPEANKRRKNNKLPPIEVPYVVITNEDETEAARAGNRLNAHQQEIDPITWALIIERDFAKGLTEAEVAFDTGLSTKEVLEHYYLLKLSKKIQGLVKAGKMTVKVALGLTHVDEAKADAMAEALVAESERVGRVSGKAVAKAKGQDTGPDRMNAKAVKAKIEEIEATAFGGKHGKAVKEAAVLALEAQLDSRKAEKLIAKLEELAK